MTSATAAKPKRKSRVQRKSSSRVLKVPALEVKQGKSRTLFSFAVDGKQLHEFCTVSRVRRDEGEMDGYQRPEVVSHITQIRDYLESDSPILPNAIVIAFNNSVKFKSLARQTKSDASFTRAGFLEITIDPDVEEADKPGWIVDGQQRAAALRDARITGFPVCVVGFVADSLEEQRQQFILVNATKPLPKGLVYELLPSTGGKLPLALQKKKLPAVISERLNFDSDSPLKGMIRTPTCGNGVIADNSILTMIQNSLTDGILYCFDDLEDQLHLLKAYWSAVRAVFPSATWNEPPRKSRLMHGAGIASMGFLMDTIGDLHVRGRQRLDQRLFERELKGLCSECHWTEGVWNFGPDKSLKWNEVQNVPGHIQLLSNHLLQLYMRIKK